MVQIAMLCGLCQQKHVMRRPWWTAAAACMSMVIHHCYVIIPTLDLCPGERGVILHGSGDDMLICMMIT